MDEDRNDDAHGIEGHDDGPVWKRPPEFDLWEAVLSAAVDDACGRSTGHNDRCTECRSRGEGVHTYRECAVLWIESDDCETICETLGVDVGYVRTKVKGMNAT